MKADLLRLEHGGAQYTIAIRLDDGCYSATDLIGESDVELVQVNPSNRYTIGYTEPKDSGFYAAIEPHIREHGVGWRLLDALEKDRDLRANWLYLPVYAYIHSGIALGHSQRWPFSCPFDSVLASFVAVYIPKMVEAFKWKRFTAARRKRLLQILVDQTEVYQKVLNGEVYGFTIHEGAPTVNGDLVDPETLGIDVLDSCWGFIGRDYAKEAAGDSLLCHLGISTHTKAERRTGRRILAALTA